MPCAALLVAFVLQQHLQQHLQQQVLLPELPTVRSPVTIAAATTPDGRDEYVYDGHPVAPVIHVRPGERLHVALIDSMSVPSREPCVSDPCRQVTNLHFHGMHVSPRDSADNILDLLARPGDTLHYTVDIPRDHPPGLFWYHPHPHGESDRQVDDGMSGAIVVDGIDSVAPEVRGLRERVLVFRAWRDEWTLNGVTRPAIDISPGERQFWRVVNASGDDFLDLELDTAQHVVWHIVALDGEPAPGRLTTHVHIPPGGRVEAIVTGPSTRTVLRTRGVDTGPDGDPDPPAILADIIPGTTPRPTPAPRSRDTRPRPIPAAALAAAHTAPEAVVTFTEDHNGFYINGRKFDHEAGPMFTVRVGSFAHWKVVNSTDEIHPFHIHQVHFLTLGDDPTWLDTVTIPPYSSIDVVLDATNPVIRGRSVFHCHMLRHEDKGMMAEVLFK
ncbi:MAG TPA: multicopper oxidase domain-containing protein [Gemmatimonadaceae bacterium]|nr:multicopper oxidase domain-containing protein [Gemmatimonadaceae bacterium]